MRKWETMKILWLWSNEIIGIEYFGIPFLCCRNPFTPITKENECVGGGIVRHYSLAKDRAHCSSGRFSKAGAK